MTIGATTKCPHCSAANQAGAQFCESCGKALPVLGGGSPRVVGGSAFASTAAGQKLQSAELHKQARRAAGALLAVAIIQTIVCIVFIVIANTNDRPDVMMKTGAFIGIGVCAVIFWALFVWARKQPLPAAIVGLILYATLVAINVVTSVSNLSKGGEGNSGFGGIGVGWIDIIILVVLARAISAGSQYRKLVQSGVVAPG